VFFFFFTDENRGATCNRVKFKAWAALQAKPDGQGYSANTIATYVSELGSTTAKLGLGEAVNPNLFAYTTADEFTPIYEHILAAPAFSDVNKAESGSYAAAMDMYRRYLQDCESGNPVRIDGDALERYVAVYKAHFGSIRKQELYKWRLQQIFQDNWDIEAEDFAEMLRAAIPKSIYGDGNNLFDTGPFERPLESINQYAQLEPENVRGMFRRLFDDSIDVIERGKAFALGCEELARRHPESLGKPMNPKAASAFLWLRFPEKYYPCKPTIIDNVSKKLFPAKWTGDKWDKLAFGYLLFDAIRATLKDDAELLDLHRSSLTPDCYPDPGYTTLTQDLAFFIANELPEQRREVEIEPEDVRPRYWMYAPGENASHWEEDIREGIMSLGWNAVGDLRQYGSMNEIKTALREKAGLTGDQKNNGAALWNFLREMKPGDIVYAKQGLYSIIGRGVVESDYAYDNTRSDFYHTRRVRWTHNGSWPHPGQAVLKALTDITLYTEYVEKLEALFLEQTPTASAADAPPVVSEPPAPYTAENFLQEVYADKKEYERLIATLEDKKNLILEGPPGTGKTFAAKRLAYAFMGVKDPERIKIVQFHQSYCYEDFIMGIRPTKEGFEIRKGPFYKFCKTAEEDSENPYFFLIDEINRGNLSKIFGELLMLIEADKRGRGNLVQLMYEDEEFFVPANVYIIGTMNTADRSLAIMDYAMRRRFCFVPWEPAFDTEGFRDYLDLQDCGPLYALAEQIQRLNEAIAADELLGAGKKIGHSYLCRREGKAVTDEWLARVVRYELIPQLREYWPDEPDKVNAWGGRLKEAIGL